MEKIRSPNKKAKKKTLRRSILLKRKWGEMINFIWTYNYGWIRIRKVGRKYETQHFLKYIGHDIMEQAKWVENWERFLEKKRKQSKDELLKILNKRKVDKEEPKIYRKNGKCRCQREKSTGKWQHLFVSLKHFTLAVV